MENDIKEGQVWSYKTRKGEETSRLTIIKIDKVEQEIIIHLSIDGLILTEKESGKLIGRSIDHLPISLMMFKSSVCIIESLTESSINEGYEYWNALFEKGKAGVWSIEIADAIQATEEAYNS